VKEEEKKTTKEEVIYHAQIDSPYLTSIGEFAVLGWM
jgi:hypothetical protein